jgi:O-antigen/teichoic acid export membrane protein
MNQTVDAESGKAAVGHQASGLAGDAAFSMMAKILYLVSRLGLPPIVLAYVSLVEYGLWAACFIVVGYIGLADLGMSSVYVRRAASLWAARDIAGVGRLLSTGIGCMFLLSLAVLGGVALSLDGLIVLLKVDDAQRAAARILILGSVAVFLLDMTLNAFSYVLHGLQRIRAEQKVWVLAFLLEFALIIAFLLGGLGVHALLLAFALRYAFSIAANARLVYRALPGLSVAPRHFETSLVREFFGFGLKVQASTIFAMALHSADRLIAGALLGPQAVALFDLGAKLPVSSTSVPSAISQVVMPAAARLDAGHAGSPLEQHAALASLLDQSTRSVALVACIPLAFLGVFSAPICLAWLGMRPDLQILPFIMTLASIGAFLHIITGPASAVFRGMGLIGNEFFYHGLRVACLAAGLAIACLWAGVNVAALASGLAAGTCSAALIYLTVSLGRMGLPFKILLKRVLLPPLLALVPTLALLALWSAAMPASTGRWQTLAALLAFGAAHSALAASVIWSQLDRRERQHLRDLLERLRLRQQNWRPA